MSLYSSLNTLESAGLIQVARVEPDLEYLFRHSMVQDAAYASLLESDRRRLHLAVGNAIEQLYPDRKNELAAILGYHFKEAGEEQRALPYFIIAGDEALSVYANREAEMQYRSALELKCCEGKETAWLYSGLGESLYRQSRFNESVEALLHGIDIYRSIGDTDGMARLYARLGRVQWFAGDRPAGLRSCLEGLEQVKDAPDSVGKATLMHETARANYFDGRSDKALPLCRQALALAEKLGATYVQADALATLGILADIPPEEALDALRKSIELAEAHKMLQVAMRAHINLGTMTRTFKGNNEVALEHFRKSAELGRLRGVASEEFLGLTSYISCLFAPGRLKEVEEELPHLDALIWQIPNPAHNYVVMKYLRGVLAWYKGNWDEAISLHYQCLEENRQQQNKESTENDLDQLSWVLLEKHRWGEAADLSDVENLLTEALQIVEHGNSNEHIWAYSRMSMLRAHQGKVAEAQQWLEKAQQEMAERTSTWDERFNYECEMEIALASQDWEAGIAASEKLVQLNQQAGFRLPAARDLLVWADFYLKRADVADLEKAESLFRQAISEFTDMGVGHYPNIAQRLLKEIQSRQRAQTLDHQQMTRELKKARQVQESLLPENLPVLAGWDLSVLLEPAHETSGDFYDFLPLPGGNLGMVIADVTDKGTGAALFMALSRSLWRTFAVDHPGEPELTLADTNRRIVEDTHGGLYITLLYGILDPHSGDFTYCSAGHHPALLLCARDGSLQQLKHTGMPLGVMEETSWQRLTVNIEPGDSLVLYTDGVTDAQDAGEEFFGLDRLQSALSKLQEKGAKEIRDGIRQEVRLFQGEAPQSDDLTLMVIVRNAKPD
jgi:serine phosphatase RsbU (regulator of sigma subunit)